MDGRKFDELTKRFSRRRAIGVLGASGAGLLGADFRPEALSAQGGTTCNFALELRSPAGEPNATTLSGNAELTIDAIGNLSGSYAAAQGGNASVSGSVDGRAVDLLVEFSDGATYALIGAAMTPFDNCPESAAGIAAGAVSGEVGRWQWSSGGTSSPPAQQSSQPGQQSGQSGQQSSCQTTSCPDGQILDQQSCRCLCPQGSEPCKDGCHPPCAEGESRDASNCLCSAECAPLQTPCTDGSQCCSGFCLGIPGACDCPLTETLCQGSCIPDCPLEKVLDPNTCQCVDPPCPGPGEPCQVNSDCCGGANYCCHPPDCAYPVPSCGSCPGPDATVCGEGICAYLKLEAKHCGACFNACGPNQRCTEGQCCGNPGPLGSLETWCPGIGCRSLDRDPTSCGTCGNACPAGQTCSNGGCI